MSPSFYRFKSPEQLRKFIESASSQVSEPVSGLIDLATVADRWDKWFRGISSDKSETTQPTPSCSEQLDPTIVKGEVNRLLRKWEMEDNDPVNHPPHYKQHPSGVECIDITEHLNFCRGNAIKYIWRAGEKSDELEDLKKARWYLDREIKRLTQEARPYLK